MFVDGAVRVRVPATSANLGPGFDALGLALARYDEVAARIVADGVHIEVRGESADDVARDESHLVLASMRRTFDALGVAQPGVALECTNAIPHARGLGSSAAAIVAGVLLARALVVDGEQLLPDPAVFSLAAGIEGHPDNVAPCLFGGLTIAWIGADGTARAVRRDPDPAVVPVVLIPPFAASTAAARALLPPTVTHSDAARNAGRAALLVAALTGTPQALFDATEDRLHQAFRTPAMPASTELLTALRDEGLPAVISGAGPTVLVLARGDVETESALAAAPPQWQAGAVAVDVAGALAGVVMQP